MSCCNSSTDFKLSKPMSSNSKSTSSNSKSTSSSSKSWKYLFNALGHMNYKVFKYRKRMHTVDPFAVTHAIVSYCK